MSKPRGQEPVSADRAQRMPRTGGDRGAGTRGTTTLAGTCAAGHRPRLEGPGPHERIKRDPILGTSCCNSAPLAGCSLFTSRDAFGLIRSTSHGAAWQHWAARRWRTGCRYRTNAGWVGTLVGWAVGSKALPSLDWVGSDVNATARRKGPMKAS